MSKDKIKVNLLSGVLISDNGRYLLIQEAKDKSYSKCKDKWTLPHGGYDVEHEKILDLAKRELLEETGGTADFDFKYICVEGWSSISDSLFLVLIVWQAVNWNKIQERRGDDTKDVKFFTKEEMKQLADEGKIRDNLPILEIINQFENKRTGILRWEIEIS
jgi:ADP-ribose pyrophosphatase YjhB (NUDIX family)